MNHLTNVYKHKCEQLQEQLNHLTRMLNEAPGGIPPRPFRGRPRIHGIPDLEGPIPHGPKVPYGPPRQNIPSLIRDIPTDPFIISTNANIIPRAWTDLLNLGNARTPSQMQELIQHLRTDTLFMTWWEQNYGILKNVGDVYQRLIHGTVWRWDNNLGAWQPINKPGTPTHFGQMGPGGVLITPHIWDPTVINPLNPPKPPPPITPPPPPPGTGWNSGTNN